MNTQDRERARRLRREASGFEQKLWIALREVSNAAQLKFRRQQPIHPFIADFACMKAKPLIELDGDSHDQRQGYTVMRINNEEIFDNLSGVVQAIIERAKSLKPPSR